MKARYQPGAAPGEKSSLETPTTEYEEVPIFDVTFVDDEAIVITAAVPATLSQRFSRAVQLLVEVFDHYGVAINWKPRKTEAIISYRGKNAKAATAELIRPEGTRSFKVSTKRVDGNGEAWVHVNIGPQYKHLVSIIDGSGNLVPEARQRVKSSMHAFAPLAERLLGSSSIGMKRRIRMGGHR